MPVGRIPKRAWDRLAKGFSEERNSFVQSYDSNELDASLLLMPLCKFIAPTDPRWLSTLDAISAELVSDSLVYRYNVDASPDGLAGEEATFSLCSFWWAEALARAASLLGGPGAGSLAVLGDLWDSAFEQGRLAALDELADRFCVCMK